MLYKKIKLADVNSPLFVTTYRARSFTRVWTPEFECLEAGGEAILADFHLEPLQLQDHPKDQGEEAIEFNLTEDGKKA